MAAFFSQQSVKWDYFGIGLTRGTSSYSQHQSIVSIVMSYEGCDADRVVWRSLERVVGIGWDESGISFKSNILEISNTNIQWQIWLKYCTVLRCLAVTWCHPVDKSMPESLHCGHTHWCFYLLSDLNMKTTSYSRQTYPHISYVHIHTLSYKVK